MDVRDVMTSRFEMIDSSTSLRHAAREMKSLDVGILPIREGTRLIGVITDRDIVLRGLAEGRPWASFRWGIWLSKQARTNSMGRRWNGSASPRRPLGDA